MQVKEFKSWLLLQPDDAVLEIELYTGSGVFKYVDLDEFNIRARLPGPVEPATTE